jgi:beta-xylosidase
MIIKTSYAYALLALLALLSSATAIASNPSCMRPSYQVDCPGLGANNPIIYADVPDMAMIRVGDTYYMSSTTMQMSPGVPIMKSKDLVNWEIVSYAYDRLEESDAMNLSNGKSRYGKGSWASSIRYYKEPIT